MHSFGGDTGPSREIYYQVNDSWLPLQRPGLGYQVGATPLETRGVGVSVGHGMTVSVTAVGLLGTITGVKVLTFGDSYAWGDVVEIKHPLNHSLDHTDVAAFRVSWWHVHRGSGAAEPIAPPSGLPNGGRNPYVVVHVHHAGTDAEPDFLRPTSINLRWSCSGVGITAAHVGRVNPVLGRPCGARVGVGSSGLNVSGRRNGCTPKGVISEEWKQREKRRYAAVEKKRGWPFRSDNPIPPFPENALEGNTDVGVPEAGVTELLRTILAGAQDLAEKRRQPSCLPHHVLVALSKTIMGELMEAHASGDPKRIAVGNQKWKEVKKKQQSRGNQVTAEPRDPGSVVFAVAQRDNAVSIGLKESKSTA